MPTFTAILEVTLIIYGISSGIAPELVIHVRNDMHRNHFNYKLCTFLYLLIPEITIKQHVPIYKKMSFHSSHQLTN